MLNDIPYYIIRALLITIVVETTIGIIIGIRNKKDILNVILVNMLTNPFVTIIPIMLNLFVSLSARRVSLVILEILVLITEALIYRKVLSYKKINWFIISLILNASSFSIGELINNFL